MIKENLLILGELLSKLILAFSYLGFIGLFIPKIENQSLAIVVLIAAATVIFIIWGVLSSLFNKAHDKLREQNED